MEPAINILKWEKKKLEMWPYTPFSERTITEIDKAIKHLESAQLIDQEPLNTLLVNALRCDTETQRLLVKNLLERSKELKLLKDPKVDGLPEDSRRLCLIYLSESSCSTAYYEKGYAMWNAYDEGFYPPDDILYYMDPSDLIKLMKGASDGEG